MVRRAQNEAAIARQRLLASGRKPGQPKEPTPMIQKEIKLTRPSVLEDRIKKIRDETNAIIDAKAAAVAGEKAQASP
jgi:hypothetical protein